MGEEGSGVSAQLRASKKADTCGKLNVFSTFCFGDFQGSQMSPGKRAQGENGPLAKLRRQRSGSRAPKATGICRAVTQREGHCADRSFQNAEWGNGFLAQGWIIYM